MELLYNIKSTLQTILPPSIWDILDIAVLAYLIYQIIRFMRETRAGGLFKGIMILLVFYVIAKGVQMKAVTFVLENAFNVGLIALMILFQPELRRSLERVGHSKFSNIPFLAQLSGDKMLNPEDAKLSEFIEVIINSCADLSQTSTGALIVIERKTPLDDIANGGSGTIINANISVELLGNIFFKNSPLHDGAVIIRENRILAAACQLPQTSHDGALNKSLGSRHRAAVGMTENSDALVIVVSEETGAISLADNGELFRNFSRDTLKTELNRRLKNEEDKKDKDNGKKEGNPIFSIKNNKKKNTGKNPSENSAKK